MYYLSSLCKRDLHFLIFWISKNFICVIHQSDRLRTSHCSSVAREKLKIFSTLNQFAYFHSMSERFLVDCILATEAIWTTFPPVLHQCINSWTTCVLVVSIVGVAVEDFPRAENQWNLGSSFISRVVYSQYFLQIITDLQKERMAVDLASSFTPNETIVFGHF